MNCIVNYTNAVTKYTKIMNRIVNYTNIYKYCVTYTNDAITIVMKFNYPNYSYEAYLRYF